MSVVIHWRPVSDKGKAFSTGTSKELEVVKDIFGSQIESKDTDKLRAMAAVGSYDFYNELADLVEQVGTIEIWGEY